MVVDDGTASGFGLSSGGEEVWLENTAGTVIDNAVFPALAETESYGRFPDGTDNWQILFSVTKGAANSNAPPSAIILMNEVYSRGIPDAPDWIELYNASTFSADISGYKLYDSGGKSGSKAKKEIPAGTTIPAGGFYVMVVDDGTASGFGLSSGGETAWFENASGTILDTIAFPAMAETESFGRLPDGSANWQLLASITKGSPNSNENPSVSERVHYWHFNDLA
jgi:hypothetical protein